MKSSNKYFNIVLIAILLLFIMDVFTLKDFVPASRDFNELSIKHAKLLSTNLNLNDKGFHINVDLDKTLLYLYKDGELIKTYPVSGGKPNTPSPLGTWKIINKDTWGDGFGGAWLGFNVPWGLYGIHGTTEPWFIGNSNTSQGCIRMKNADVKELYNTITYGTTVTIVHKNRPFHTMRDGDVGSDILEVEKALCKLGYYSGSEDGIFGSTLKASVRKFQKENKLYVTGVINISTYNLIMEKFKVLEEEQAEN